MTATQQFILELLKEGRAYLGLILPIVTALLAPSPIQHLFNKKEDSNAGAPK